MEVKLWDVQVRRVKLIIYGSQYTKRKENNKSQYSVMQHISQPGGDYINQPEGGLNNSD